jgi:hypothetical protein
MVFYNWQIIDAGFAFWDYSAVKVDASYACTIGKISASSFALTNANINNSINNSAYIFFMFLEDYI